MVKVSIIVPVYKVEKYLAECLDSLIRQTLREIEILCINDGSPDASMEILQAYARKDARIRIILQRNQGLSAARNTGLARARAPYLMFCDSDDFYHPEMCEKMYRAITDSEADLAICGVETFYEDETIPQSADDQHFALPAEGKHCIDDALRIRLSVNVWNKIWRRDWVNAYDISYPVGLVYEDLYFYDLYIDHAKTIYVQPERLYTYRRRGASIVTKMITSVTNRPVYAEDLLHIFMGIYEHRKQHGRWFGKEEVFLSRFEIFFSEALGRTTTKVQRQALYEKGMNTLKSIFPKLSELPNDIRHALINLGYPPKVRTWGGLLTIKRKDNSTRVLFLRLPIYTAKYTRTKTTIAILGIPVWTKRIAQD